MSGSCNMEKLRAGFAALFADHKEQPFTSPLSYQLDIEETYVDIVHKEIPSRPNDVTAIAAPKTAKKSQKKKEKKKTETQTQDTAPIKAKKKKRHKEKPPKVKKKRKSKELEIVRPCPPPDSTDGPLSDSSSSGSEHETNTSLVSATRTPQTGAAWWGVGSDSLTVEEMDIDTPPEEDETDQLIDIIPQLRPYQQELYEYCMQHNSIVWLPTGLGKTFISVAVAQQMIRRHPDKVVVFIADRIPLVMQQGEVFEKFGFKVGKFCAEKKIRSHRCSKKDAPEMGWSNAMKDFHVIASIDKMFLNELTHKAITLETDVSCIIFDECHHCVKQATMARIMKTFYWTARVPPKIVGLTASPGCGETPDETEETIRELASTMHSRIFCAINNAENQELHTKRPRLIEWEFHPDSVNVTMKTALNKASYMVEDYISTLRVAKGENPINWAKTQHNRIDQAHYEWLKQAHNTCDTVYGPNDNIKHAYKALLDIADGRIYNEELSLATVFEHLAECNNRHMGCGIDILSSAFQRLLEIRDLPEMQGQGLEKMQKVGSLLEVLEALWNNEENRRQYITAHGENKLRAIVFVQAKKTCLQIEKVLTSHPSLKGWVKPRLFMGHKGASTKIGMSTTEQSQVVSDFRAGEANLLIATSVAEEGFDIPSCNVVIRFDPPATVAAFIQSRGRARFDESVYISILQPDSEDHDLFTNIQAKETMMADVIRLLHHDPSVGAIGKQAEDPTSWVYADPQVAIQQYCKTLKTQHSQHLSFLKQFPKVHLQGSQCNNRHFVTITVIIPIYTGQQRPFLTDTGMASGEGREEVAMEACLQLITKYSNLMPKAKERGIFYSILPDDTYITHEPCDDSDAMDQDNDMDDHIRAAALREKEDRNGWKMDEDGFVLVSDIANWQSNISNTTPVSALHAHCQVNQLEAHWDHTKDVTEYCWHYYYPLRDISMPKTPQLFNFVATLRMVDRKKETLYCYPKPSSNKKLAQHNTALYYLQSVVGGKAWDYFK